MIEYLRELTKNEAISLSDYIRACLYHENFGYYKKQKKRVGYDGDFYTSSTLKGGVFAKLLRASAKKLSNSKNLKICEIGAEPENSLFIDSQVIRLGDEIKLEGDMLLFSNELLDAQPFDRFKFENKKIHKTFVRFFKDALEPEISYQEASEFEYKILKKYFEFNSDAFFLDFSFAALNLFKNICSQNWQGVLIFADYFRSSAELMNFPKGSGRVYKKHEVSTNLFQDFGSCDITFSPCYEDFLDILTELGTENFGVETQAKFFMENAQEEIKNIVENSSVFSAEKRALSELLSPSYFGEVFRVLYALKNL